MSNPYPPMGPGEQPPAGWPGGWGGTPPPAGGYGPSGPDWQRQETMMGPPMGPPAMTPPYGPPPAGQPMGPYPQYPMGPSPRRGGAGLIAAVVAAAVVVVGGTLGGAYYAAASGGDDARARPVAGSTAGSQGPSAGRPGSSTGEYEPGYYNATKSWSLWNPLNTASSDSKPLSLGEVFAGAESKSQNDSIEHMTMSLQGQGRLDAGCGGAVWGPALRSALQGYGCTQVVRAVYVSADQRWVGQLAIFNLRDVNASDALIRDLDPKGGAKGFFLPLAGQPPADRFGRGMTGVSGGAYGHFVVLGWAGHADGAPGDRIGADTIVPASLTERAGKEFLFTRNTGG